MNEKTLAAQMIKAHEGLELKPYLCTADKITIGYGRNLDDVGISKEEAEFLLDIDIHKAVQDVQAIVPNYKSLSRMRRAVLIDMMYNLGRTRFSKFKNMLSALEELDFDQAAHEMLDSRWAVQVGDRATFLARKMEEGV